MNTWMSKLIDHIVKKFKVTSVTIITATGNKFTVHSNLKPDGVKKVARGLMEITGANKDS